MFTKIKNPELIQYSSDIFKELNVKVEDRWYTKITLSPILNSNETIQMTLNCLEISYLKNVLTDIENEIQNNKP